MKTNYFLLLLLGLLFVGCNKTTKTEKDTKTLATKKEGLKEESAFTYQQISNLEFQVGAFKIGSEKVSNAELKKYLLENLPKLEEMLKEYKSAVNLTTSENTSDKNERELYKLAIADTKGFDNVFILYYKDFLKKTIHENSSQTLDNEIYDSLKNRYGNILYEQKLYFDVLK